jgi:ADP-ribose pyrophosphatase YjhB (NUDIX family)
MQNKPIQLLVRAIIEKDSKILVCHKKGKDYYFLPGGHVEFGESSEYALAREIKEELGIEMTGSFFIGGTEHMFEEDGARQHEVNLVFKVEVDKIKIESEEDHLQFFLLDPEQFEQENILPSVLKNALLQWFQEDEKFWANDL